MSDPSEGNPDDLFDFERLPDLEPFGLSRSRSEDAAADADASDASAAASTRAEAASAAKADGAPAAARPNPPVPEGVDDLDDDLFGFDELFSLEDDPYYNGTLDDDGQPTTPLLREADGAQDPAAADVAALQGDDAGALAASADSMQTGEVPSPAASPDESARDLESPSVDAEPNIAPHSTSKPDSLDHAKSATAAGDLFDEAGFRTDLGAAETLHLTGAGSAAGHAPSLRDRGPRILLPEDVPYSERADRQRMIWALVACFLAVNTGIFVLAQRANSSFQTSLTEATRVLADALAKRSTAPTHAAEPIGVDPTTSHSLEVQEPGGRDPRVAEGGTVGIPDPGMEDPRLQDPRLQDPRFQDGRNGGTTTPDRPAKEVTPETPIDLDRSSEPPTEPPTEPRIDPRKYENTHDIAVGTAKAMLTEGRFEDSRRLLNHVLANQDRIPLSPQLREEIDYLIPLTYFEQGRATAAEDSK